ncbi:hypothetical protein PTSG_00939 [Salpingoeca rosetta]|uniref:PH domain-containing protein n=1 Tax=Salpingoeca rosetta (strain ATCC 50818 / BSB-021) TaxID=946362 RepID=F2TXX9_SALR5|nr:uncharacterized protein PTSG_00939 [Salpingoeca rosetta]EGD76238.1 hypothetical protein PTSG_00939 [Salpingoeca rosetta]|eukprot:XP_004998413.1 hypothetical protein PTSG_00939 [Salpingoeca rosetta]
MRDHEDDHNDYLPARSDVPIMSGMMYKRAQGRSTFGRTNWKKRWFVLHPGELSYWTLEGGRNNPASECKGVIPLSNVYTLERVSLEAFGKPHMIQIVHTSVLYVQCPSREDCDEWLLALRKQCATNRILHAKYHPGFFDGSKWSCCGITSKDFKGCQKSFDYSSLFRKTSKAGADAATAAKTARASSSSGSGMLSPKNGVVTQNQAKMRKASTQSRGDSRSPKASRDFHYVPSVKPIKHASSSPLRQSMNPPSSTASDQQPVIVRVTRVAYV